MNVLAKLHQDEPVSKVEFLHDDLDVVQVAGLGPTAEDKNTRCPGDDGDDSEAEEDAGPSDEDHEPEPEEDIDLLVDDIQRQNAQT